MKGTITKLALLVNVATAAVLHAPHIEQKSERDIASYNFAQSQCDGLINTEVVFDNVTGTYDCTVMEGMGPGSAWYEEHVAPFDPANFGEDERAGYMVDGRDLDYVGDNMKRGPMPPISYHVSRGKAQTHYGTISMEEAISVVTAKCGLFDCKTANGGTTKTFTNVPYVVKVDTSTQVGTKQVHGSLVLTAHGTFPPKKKNAEESVKGHFVNAVTQIGKKIHKYVHNKKWNYCDETVHGPTGCYNGVQKDNYFGGSYFYIQRNVRTVTGVYAQSGALTVRAAMHEYTNTVCDQIMMAINEIASAADPSGLYSIANDYFGKYIQKDVCA